MDLYQKMFALAMSMIGDLAIYVVLALAIASFSVTTAKAKVTKPVREFFLARVKPLGMLLSCPYCVSHWLAFALVLLGYAPGFCDNPVMDFLVQSFALVAVASLISGTMMRLMFIQEDQIEDLRKQLEEARDAIRELVGVES